MFQLLDTLTCYGSDFSQVDPPLSTPLLLLRTSLDPRHPALWRPRSGAWKQVRIVFRKFVFDRLEVVYRIVASAGDTSIRCTSRRVRSMWRRNWMPRPCPKWAPSMRPGMSATTNDRSRSIGDHAQIGFERGEWVVGDFRACCGDAGDERRFA